MSLWQDFLTTMENGEQVASLFPRIERIFRVSK